MIKSIFWRLFKAAVLTTVVWISMGLDVYGGLNDTSSGGTLYDVFRGRSSSSNTKPTASAPMYSGNQMIMPAPQMTNVPAQPNDYAQPYETVEGTTRFPNSQYVSPAAPSPQPAVQNKWSLKSWLTGAAPVQPQTQYVEPAPPLMPMQAHNQPHSHAPHSAMSKGKSAQYRVVPLDSEDFRPQEGAIYNEKGEIIFSPESGGVMPEDAMPNVAEGEMVYDNNGNRVVYDNNSAAPFIESDSGVRRIVTGGQTGIRRSTAPVNQELVYSQQQVYPNAAVRTNSEPIPAQIPVNPYAQQPTVSAGNPPVGTGKSILSGNSGTLKLNSGASAFSKTYKPGPVRTSVPTEPVMDMTGPDLADALPQEAETSPAVSKNIVGNRSAVKVEPQASKPAASPVIEELPNASPLENLSEKKEDAPVLEPVPESVPEIDVPKEKPAEEDSRQETVDSSEDTQSVSQTPIAAPQTDNKQETVGCSDSPSTNSTPLATRNSQLATQTPLIVEISGPEEVEFGKNEMFSLSVINTTDAIRRDIVLSVHPEGFGNDKTASLNLEQLAPGEKKSIYMKLNARQYNNLSLTAQVRDALGFETTKTINVNVKNESVKISILPPPTGKAFVGLPTQYVVRIVNNAPRVVSLNAVAFFGNGIEPIRASGAPNTIQSGQVVVNKPIELKQGEMRDLKIIAVAFQPGIHKILVQLIDSRGASYAAKESCAYRQREIDEDETETIETDARIELTPGESEIGVWKPAGDSGNRQEAVGSSENTQATNGSESRQTRGSADGERRLAASQLATPDTPALNSPDAIPLTQPDQGPKGDLIMPMFAQ